MTIHACRDLLIGGYRGWASGTYDTMWAISVFLQGVLGYTVSASFGTVPPPTYSDYTINYYNWNGSSFSVVSSSIISINSGSCWVTSSGGHTLLQFSTDVVNLLAAAYPTNWPSGSGPWPTGNPFTTRSWVALKSNLFPLANSGIFAITGSTLWLTGNYLEIDYRSPSPTQIETGSFLQSSFWIPPPGSDNYNPSRTSNYPSWIAGQHDNGGPATSYKGQGAASGLTRMLLTSPGPLAWQVRLAIEGSDRQFQGQTNFTPALTCIPGFSGSATADFPTSSNDPSNRPAYHLHLPQWLNNTSAQYGNCMPGLDTFNIAQGGVQGPTGYNVRYRLYAWGDDTNGTCGVFIRNNQNSSDAYCMWGQAEQETVPLPPLPIQRLFFIGANNQNQGVDWRMGPYNTDGIGGMAYSMDRTLGPVACVLSSWAYVATQTSNGPPGGNSDNGGSIRFDKNGPLTPFMGGVLELLPVEVVAGTWDNWFNPTSFQDIIPMEPRSLGRGPLGCRFGSSITMPSWGAADTAMLWFHMTNGFFMPWGGIQGL
jgi:hypothetical protein